MKKLFVITCESSGDKFASLITKDLKNVNIEGIGGANLLQNGLKQSLVDIKELSVMGFFEVMKKAFKINKIIKKTAKYILDTNQEIVLSFDSYSFCVRVAKIVKKANKNIKFIHVVAPSVWLYGEHRAKIMATYYDKLFCLLPFETQYFEKYGLSCEFIGYHSLYYKDNVIQDNNFNIAITLGSREFELKNNIPIIKQVIAEIEKVKKCNFYFPCTSELIESVKKEFNSQNHFCILNTDMRPQYNFVIAKSGTNTMQFIAQKELLIVYYKVNKLTEIMIKLKTKNKFKFANLINIIANKEIIPEFLQENFNATNISKYVINAINDKSVATNQIQATQTIVKQLQCPIPLNTPQDCVVRYLSEIIC